jgi:PAP2 superfamily
MKNYNKLFIFAVLSFSIFAACNKEITEIGSDWTELIPNQLDTNAGSWKPITLAAVTDIQIPAPEASNSAAYQAELQKVKTTIANLTADQKAAIQYWSAGGTLRWNQIMRGLVAKYNLAPQDKVDGTYPVPDQTNPFAYPTFPFANPPYAARAYAYVTVGQYDALVAAYKLKSQYKRATPYKNDATIQPSVAKADVYAYPSEDAALATVSVELLKFLFPTEVEFLNQKANEHRWYKFWAGAATESDILAGDSVGRAVIAKVLGKAKTDNMKNALGTQAKWDSLAQNRIVLNETPWKSMETPARPPMLPFYGNVRTWLVTDLASIRPIAPPSTSSEAIKTQLAEIKSFTENPKRENVASVHFWADGTGTHTPPGHWNALASDLIKKANMSEVRTARNLALLNMSMMDAAISCWNTKTYYFYPRPSQLDPTIKTLTGLPNFPAYTSGHSTFSGAAATILGHIFPSDKANLNAQAEEASLSRLYGGIHYRMDCETGMKTGQQIGAAAIARAKTDGAE